MTHLVRIDPARNMARFYALAVEPDLFGCWLLVSRWGRIGTSGRAQSQCFATPAEATAAGAEKLHRKRRRGYH